MTRRAPGEGSLYQDEGGRWVGMYEAGIHPKSGNRRRRRFTGEQGESKASVARRLKARIAEFEATSAGPTTTGELVALWREREAPKRNSASTLDGYDAIIVKHIEPVWADVKLNAVTVDDVEGFLDARGDLSRSYLAKVKRVLSQSFQFGVRRRYINWNPPQLAELPVDLKPPREGRALTLDELSRLFNVARHHRNGAIVVVAATLGLRVQEATALSWDHIDLKTGRLHVVQALEWSKKKKAKTGTTGGPRLKEPKTSRSERVLNMPPVTVEALTDHRKAWNEERLLVGDNWPRQWASLVFVTSAGTPIRPEYLRRWLDKLTVEAGIEGRVSPKDWRTTATSLISDSGLSLERRMDLLGHKDGRTLLTHYRKPVQPSVDTAVTYWGSPEVATKVAKHSEKETSEKVN